MLVMLPPLRVGSPFSRLLLSMKRATNTAPKALLPRLKAIPLRYANPLLPARTVGSAAALNPRNGDASPCGDVSNGYPGSSALLQVSPPSNDLNTPSQA